MSTKLRNLQTVGDSGAVLIVRLTDPDDALNVAKAAIDGGIRALEITLSVPGALRLVELLAGDHRHEGIVVGAGTILDAQSAYNAVEAGAEMLVSPQLNPEMIAVSNRYQTVSISGAYTPTEIVNTVQAGADIVKLFPAEFLGPKYVKTVMAPLPHVPLAPTGGVTPDNVLDWFDAGVTAVGVGSFITKAAADNGDYQRVVEAAKTFVAAIDNARAELNRR